MNGRLLKGVLVAAALSAGVLTVAEETDHTAPGPEPQVGILKLAPQGAIGIVHVDVEKLLAAPALAPLRKMLGPDFAVVGEDRKSLDMFVLPEQVQERFVTCALVRQSGPFREAFDERIAESEEVPIGRFTAYRAQSSPGHEAFAMPIDAETIVLADTEDAALAMAEAYASGSGGAPHEDLPPLVAPYAGRPVCVAWLTEGGLGAAATARGLNLPAAFHEVRGTAFGIDLGEGLQFDGTLRYREPAEATQAAEDLTAGIADFIEMMGPAVGTFPVSGPPIGLLAGFIHKIDVSAVGRDVRLSVSLTPEDVQATVPMVMMVLIARRMD